MVRRGVSTLQHYVRQLISHYEQLPSNPEIEQVGLKELSLSDGTDTYVIRATRDPEPVRAAFERFDRLRDWGFTDFVPILPTREGKAAVSWGRSYCYLEPLYPIAKVDETDTARQLTETLAHLHNSTEQDEEVGVLIHGGLHPEAVRRGRDDRILLSHWTNAHRSKSGAPDVAGLIDMLTNWAPEGISQLLQLYMSAANLASDEAAAFLQDLEESARGQIPTWIEETDDDASQGTTNHEETDRLLVQARTAAARGKWVCGEEDAMKADGDFESKKDRTSKSGDLEGEECHEAHWEQDREEQPAGEECTQSEHQKTDNAPARQKERESGKDEWQTETADDKEDSAPLQWRFPPPLEQELVGDEAEDASDDEEEDDDEDEIEEEQE